MSFSNKKKSIRANKVKVFFYPITLICEWITFWKVPSLRSFALLVRETCGWRWVSIIGGMVLMGKQKYLEEKIVPVPFCPPQIPRGLIWNGSRPHAALRRKHGLFYLKFVLRTSQSMLYSEIIAVCSQIHTKHLNTLCGQNVECRTYRAVNIFHLRYKNQSVNAVQWNNRCLFSHPHQTLK